MLQKRYRLIGKAQHRSTKLVKGIIDGGYEEKIIHFIKNFVSFFSMGKGELNQDLWQGTPTEYYMGVAIFSEEAVHVLCVLWNIGKNAGFHRHETNNACFLTVVGPSPPSHASIPPNQNSTMAKDDCWVGKMNWRRDRALDKTVVRFSCVVCISGTFIGCVDKKWVDNKGWKNSKCLIRWQKFDRTAKVDKTTKGE